MRSLTSRLPAAKAASRARSQIWLIWRGTPRLWRWTRSSAEAQNRNVVCGWLATSRRWRMERSGRDSRRVSRWKRTLIRCPAGAYSAISGSVRARLPHEQQGEKSSFSVSGSKADATLEQRRRQAVRLVHQHRDATPARGQMDQQPVYLVVQLPTVYLSSDFPGEIVIDVTAAGRHSSVAGLNTYRPMCTPPSERRSNWRQSSVLPKPTSPVSTVKPPLVTPK